MGRERYLIGQGNENNVWQRRNNGIVFKTPTVLNSASFLISSKSPKEVIEDELARFKMDPDSRLKFPKTRVFSIKNSYVMVQEYIEEDGSLTTADRHKIVSSSSAFFERQYNIWPRNFIAHNKDLYFIDLTIGCFTRIIDSFKFGSDLHRDKLVQSVSKFLRRSSWFSWV